MSYKITVLPGDGIGKEVTDSAIKIMNLVAEKFNIDFEYDYRLMGGCSYDEYGTPLTDDTLQSCLKSDAVLLGAVGGYKWETLPHHLKPEAALLKLRKELGLYANLRPAKVFDALVDASTLKKEVLQGTDFLVVRELTGGVYFGQPRGYDENRGWNTMEYTKPEVERIAKMAFELSKGRDKRVTSVDKANVLECSQFWRINVHELHKEYSDIKLNDMYVDNAAMQIVRNPKQFDVIVTQNLFGDILSDISGMITGSLGMLPSASLGNEHALYEPIHGSAPDIAGQNKANPIATILSVAMMFNHTFHMKKAAEVIEEAIEKTLENGYRTADIFSEGCKMVTTEEMTEIVAANLTEIVHSQAIGVFTL